jgi:UDP-N-acetylglucosamine 3-dehydrogenase
LGKTGQGKIMKAGVIGLGYWGSKVAKEYIELVNDGLLESVTLCDTFSAKLKPFVGLCKTTDQVDQFLKEIDMLHVCTPNATHFEIGRKALEQGVNVLIEKPMAEDVNHAFDLAELSMKKGLVLQVGHIFRFSNVVRKIKEMYENKEFGEPYYFNLEWTHLIPAANSVDVIFDLLPHPLDIINFISGKWPTDFKGIGRPFRRAELVEAAFIECDYQSFFANIHLSWVNPIKSRRLDIIGSKKSISADCVKQTATVFEGNNSYKLEIEPNNTIRAEICNFTESIKTGKSDFNSCIMGARSIEVISRAINAIYADPKLKKTRKIEN